MSESFRALYDANAQAIEIESLKMQIDELHAALAERDAKLAALEKQDRHVRRLLCIAVADRPYMDDGEASDQEIDYLREPPADIERKLQERGKKRLAAAGAAPVPEDWRSAVAMAYGHLWHINNEPMAPIPLRSEESASYAARKLLRDLMTTKERGEAINAVQKLLAAAPKEPT